MTRYFIFAVTMFVCSCGSKNQSAKHSTAKEDQPLKTDDVVNGDKARLIDQHLLALFKDKNFSGCVFITKNDSLLLMKGYGYANRTMNLSYTPATLSCIGSITKMFTATAILKLYQQHKIKLSDKISTFFDNVPADKKNITIHQLLTHSSGFHEFLRNDGGDFEKIETADFLKRAFSEPLAFKPGAKAVYTNVGMSLLGIIIEKVSGKEYETFLQDELFTPAGITQIGYFNSLKDTSQIAIGYEGSAYWGTLLQRYAEHQGGPFWNLKANGGLYASSLDMFLWTRELHQSILPDSLTQIQFSPHIAENGQGGLSFFGYGCNIGKSKRNTPFIDNGGSNGIYYARLVQFPKEALVFYIATNNSEINANQILPEIIQLYFDGHIALNPGSQIQQFEFKGAEFLYKIMKEKGAVYFKKNIFSELKNNGFSTQDDMYFLEAGQKLIIENSLNEALTLYLIYTQYFPNIVVAWNDLGEIYIKKGEKDKAVECFKKALQLKPENERAKTMLEQLQ